MSFKNFIFSKLFLKNFGLAIIIVIASVAFMAQYIYQAWTGKTGSGFHGNDNGRDCRSGKKEQNEIPGH